MGECFHGWFIYPGTWGWPAVLLAACVGVLAWLIAVGLKALAGFDVLPAVMIALILGMATANVPASRSCLGFDGGSIKWSEGLGFVDKMLLRTAIILQGFFLQSSLLVSNLEALGVTVFICAVTQPIAFFTAQVSGTIVRLPYEARDMLGIGTMICGSSAITALQAVLLNAKQHIPHMTPSKQEEQVIKHTGLCTSATFLYSVLALLVFPAIARVAGFSDVVAGLWAGLAVNDLSVCIALGSEFGADGQSFSALAKTVRILTLAPNLVWWGFRVTTKERTLSSQEGGCETKSDETPAQDSFLSTLWNNFPLFMFGFLALFLLRMYLDASITSQAGADAVLQAESILKPTAKTLMLTVVAGIGLRLEIARVLMGGRYLVVAGFSWLALSSVSFGLLLLYTKGPQEPTMSILTLICVGISILAIGAVVYYFGPLEYKETTPIVPHEAQGLRGGYGAQDTDSRI